MNRRTAIVAGAAVLAGAAGLYEFGWSPAKRARLTLAGHTIAIDYSAPSVRGRQIFGAGGLLSGDPSYPVWRAGANFATTLHTSADLDLRGLIVPAGAYTLYILVDDPDGWQLIVNTQTGQWGRSYDARRDLGRVRMTMSVPPAIVETLAFSLIGTGSRTGELRVQWERHDARMPFALADRSREPSPTK